MIQRYARGWWQNGYDAVAPGNRIPKWFKNQSMGCSVKVELPSVHCLNTELLGMAVCAVVGVKGVIDPFPTPSIFVNYDDDPMNFLHSSLDCSMKSDHMWFGYRSLFNLSAAVRRPQGGTVVASFIIVGGGKKLEVRKCGVRLVYKGEVPFSRKGAGRLLIEHVDG